MSGILLLFRDAMQTAVAAPPGAYHYGLRARAIPIISLQSPSTGNLFLVVKMSMFRSENETAALRSGFPFASRVWQHSVFGQHDNQFSCVLATMAKPKSEDIANLDIVEKFETYEDYLDSQLTANDMGYLEDEEMARQLVELGYRGLGDTIRREVHCM
jgi:hypothetical protein